MFLHVARLSILLAEQEKNFSYLAQILGPTLAWERSAELTLRIIYYEYIAYDYFYACPLWQRQPLAEDGHCAIERGQRRRNRGVGPADAQVEGE